MQSRARLVVIGAGIVGWCRLSPGPEGLGRDSGHRLPRRDVAQQWRRLPNSSCFPLPVGLYCVHVLF